VRSESLVLVAAALLRVPSRRLRALALGDQSALRDWLANESASRLAEARRDARLAGEAMLRSGAARIAGRSLYPGGLKALRDPPPFLIVRGTLERTPWPRGVALVGGAKPTPKRRISPEHWLGGDRAGRERIGPGHRCGGARGRPRGRNVTLAYVAHGLGQTYPRPTSRSKRRSWPPEARSLRAASGRSGRLVGAHQTGSPAGRPRRRGRARAEPGGRRSDAHHALRTRPGAAVLHADTPARRSVRRQCAGARAGRARLAWDVDEAASLLR